VKEKSFENIRQSHKIEVSGGRFRIQNRVFYFWGNLEILTLKIKQGRVPWVLWGERTDRTGTLAGWVEKGSSGGEKRYVRGKNLTGSVKRLSRKAEGLYRKLITGGENVGGTTGGARMN